MGTAKHSENVHYEFGGPLGSGFITISLPFIVLGLCYLCRDEYCLHGFQLGTIDKATENLPEHVADLLRPRAFFILIQWLLFQVALDKFLPGKSVEGVKLKDGGHLRYKLSGHAAFWASIVTMSIGTPLFDGVRSGALRPFRLALAYDMFEELAVASAVISFVLSIALYTASQRSTAKLAEAGGAIGRSVVYDFFIGRELNPRVGELDLKFFCELRPGIIGWVIINMGMMCKEWEMKGYVSVPMIMVNLFQGLYAWDALFFEQAILTTMDITTDGFGYMLVFGDLCWVPFVYSLQARYLVDHDSGLSAWLLCAIGLMNMLGYAIFRGANGQKDTFRRDPHARGVAHLKWMPTKRGTKLLTSGWWGAARKINYTGDLLMGTSWCLLTGFQSPVPYFYAIYFGILLVHRAYRDDHACGMKYGQDWTTYKRRVPSLFIPGVI